jgi:integrase
MLSLYRRHIKKCPHRREGREHSKCSCPIWCDGELNGERCRKTLKTRDWQRALRLAERLERPNAERTDLVPCAQPGCNHRVERGRCQEHRRGLAEAIEAFHAASPDMAHGSMEGYRRILRLFLAHASSQHATVDAITPDVINTYRAGRPIVPITWRKELQILHRFFAFCLRRKWISENPTNDVPAPRNIKPTDKDPYTRDDIVKILAATEAIGNEPYERLRARALVLMLRYTALRIGDVATLAKDRIRAGEIYLRTTKAGKVVKLPVHPELQAALEVLPEPRGSAGESRYFFWSGNGVRRTAVRNATQSLTRVFRRSGVAGSHAHRFRHTLATEILENGGTFEEAADVLGNSPDIVRKYYAKWSSRRQERISTLMGRIFGTSVVHEKIEPVTVRFHNT